MVMAQPLLTPASVALSLSPPRTPPHGSVLRNLLLNPKHGGHHHHHHRDDKSDRQGEDDGSRYRSHTLRSRLLQLLAPHFRLRDLARHPHLPAGSLSLPDRLTRFLGAVLPLERQHSGRDSGRFRSIVDGAVALTCPTVALGHWTEAREFLELSCAEPPGGELSPSSRAEQNGRSPDTKGKGRHGRKRRWTRKRVPYGDHSMQYFDLFLPASSDRMNDDAEVHSRSSDSCNKTSVRGTLFFVHGGAWGSGHPWMYRLVAPAFLKLNFAVVIAGYRTYPDAPTIDDQVEDVRWAWDKCEDVLNEFVVPDCGSDSKGNDRWTGNVICGHSSGAHVALLMLVDMIGEKMKNNNVMATADYTFPHYPWDPHFFVGLSGPYNISYHFDYEAGRGVEQISPMKPICGHTRENFAQASPVKRLLSLLGKQRGESTAITSSIIQQLAPPILLVHGIEDSTVPFTATSDAGRHLRSCGLNRCEEVYLEETSHQEVIMHFMLGGSAKDVVLDWLLQCSKGRSMAQLKSRL